MRGTLLWTCVAWLAFATAGCGGTSQVQPGAASTPAASTPAPVTLRTAVRVHVTDEAGLPVEAAQVDALGQTGFTDARGVAEFPEVQVSFARGSVLVRAETYYDAHRTYALTAGATIMPVRLVRERIMAVLGVRTTRVGADGDRLSADVDLAMFARDGSTAGSPATFRIDLLDCGYGPADCATGPDGRTVPNGGAYSWAPPVASNVASIAARSDAPVVAGFVVDVGARVAPSWDVNARRFDALRIYFDDADGATVALGTVGGGPATPVPPSGFDTDAARFDAVLNELADASAAVAFDARVAYDAIAEMAVAAADATAPDGARRSVVALLPDFEGFDAPCVAGNNCRRSLDATIALARSRGVAVFAIGNSDHLADAAARTGGVYVQIDRASELEGAMRALPALLDGTSPGMRVGIDLRAMPGTFVPGGTVYAILEFEVAPEQIDYVRLAIPIPES